MLKPVFFTSMLKRFGAGNRAMYICKVVALNIAALCKKPNCKTQHTVHPHNKIQQFSGKLLCCSNSFFKPSSLSRPILQAKEKLPLKGRAIAQAVSRWLPTAAARVWQVGFVVDKVTLRQVFSEYFGFPCQSSLHQILHYHNHPGQVQ
jgi:hypothetical protein